MRNDESKAFNVYHFFYQNLVFQTFENMTFLYIYKQPTQYNESGKKHFLIREICYKNRYRSTSISRIPRELRKHFELSEVRDKQIETSPKFMFMYNIISFVEIAFLQNECNTNVVKLFLLKTGLN